LFVGDDWAESHHDVEVQDGTGQRMARVRLPEGAEGIRRLHALLGEHLADHLDPEMAPGQGEEESTRQTREQVVIGIETDRGSWVAALVAAGYQVYAINPMSVARYRQRYSTSGAKSDAGDAHVLAEIVRLDRGHHRPVAGDSATADGLQLIARAHQVMIWDRQRHVLRLRSALREFYPSALAALATAGLDLDDADALELLRRAPDPDRGARLTRSTIAAVLRRSRRRGVEAKTNVIVAELRAATLRRADSVQQAFGAVVSTQVEVITTVTAQVAALEEAVAQTFQQHPDAAIYASQPGLGTILGARVLGEFGDDPTRYADARARKNYAGTSPITRASGKKTTVLRRYARNRRLTTATHGWAFSALRASPGARAYYDTLRARGVGHHAALRQLAHRLVGILHGCLKTTTPYNEATAWSHRLTT
jgi:hypothetical protein